MITDTVGFIQKLPTTLVEAFHATLEEIVEADLLLHVVDISHPNALNQFNAVQDTLDELGAHHIPMVTALNKVDKLRDPEAAKAAASRYSKSGDNFGLEREAASRICCGSSRRSCTKRTRRSACGCHISRAR